jgi:hypothetical protein
MNIQEYVKEISADIDAARTDLWDTNKLDNIRGQSDKFEAAHSRQAQRAELWDAILKFRMEEINEEELYMFFQSFDKELTYYDFVKVLASTYKRGGL